MKRRPSTRSRLADGLAAPWLVAVLAIGCRSEPPPSPVGAAISPDVETEGEPTQESEAVSRELWFPSGPGRDAILARERRDFAAATGALDALLSSDDLSPDDRGAAQWLRGLEDLRSEQYASAADRFAAAREVPGLAPVELRLRWLQAQAHLDASKPVEALALVQDIAPADLADSPLRDDYIIVEADARARTGDPAGARTAYERYLKAFPKGKRRFEVQAKLARLLADGDSEAEAKAAIALYEALLRDSPLSDFGEEAAQAERKLRAKHKLGRSAAEQRSWEREMALARLEAELDRRRYAQAVSGADALLRDRQLSVGHRCHALYAKGTAIFKMRKRAKSRPVFEQAAKACQDAGKPAIDQEVKSRFQAARGLYAEGKHARAAAGFEALAGEHATHSYADDAWVLAGESWLEHGNRDKEAAAYRHALEVDGDMADEARRRLLLLTFDQGDAAGAKRICDEALAKKIADPNVAAKLHYLRGRANQRTGDLVAARKDWVATVQAEPLGYPALQALSRLRELGDEALAVGVAALEANTKSEAQSDPTEGLESKGNGARRALILARLGLGEEARDELAAAHVDGWPAVAVLDQAGLYPEGQRLLANMGRTWRTQPPGPANQRNWELAHPRPFADLIGVYEGTHQVPSLLTFAVMQTESRFDPGVTSWAGARGLIQLMPATAKGVATELGMKVEPDNLFDPTINLDLGMRYLGKLVGRFGGSDAAVALAVPSYNAGAGAVDRWLGERGHWDLDLFVEAIPYDETRHYTQRVLGRWWAYRWIYGGGDPMERVPAIPLQIPSGGPKD